MMNEIDPTCTCTFGKHGYLKNGKLQKHRKKQENTFEKLKMGKPVSEVSRIQDNAVKQSDDRSSR